MKKYAFLLALALALVIPHWTCTQALLTAPPGSTITLFANPTFIGANGDVSSISALVTEPAGTVVPDGTVVLFFTDLGRIEPQAKTNDGVAHVNLISDSRSGQATVIAVSGGSAPLPEASASPGTGTGGTGSTSAASAKIQVTIGSARPARLVLVADPPRVLGVGPTRQSHLVANVFDNQGNPVAGVAVIFTLTSGGTTPGTTVPASTLAASQDGTFTEYLVSGSAPVYTDTNGQAEDFLRTHLAFDAPPKVDTVTATTSNGISNTVQVQIN